MATPPDFTAGSVLTAAQMNAVGLWLVKTQTLNAVSNNITSCFTSDFDSYHVVISGFSTATTTIRTINVRLLAGTTPDTSSNYSWMYNLAYGANLGGNSSSQNVAQWEVGVASTRAGQSIIIDFNSPQKATASSISFQSVTYQSDVPSYIIRQGGGGHNVATAYDGFQIYGATDALSGTVRVYGYRN